MAGLVQVACSQPTHASSRSAKGKLTQSDKTHTICSYNTRLPLPDWQSLLYDKLSQN